jgi:RNA recognition motif-containing protein
MGGNDSSMDHPVEVAASDILSARDTTVWVGGIPNNYHESDLSRIFSQFGEVAAVSIRRKGGSTGHDWGFVLFGDTATATQVLANETVVDMGIEMKIRKPDHKNMSNADMRSMGHVWREMIKKTSHGKYLDNLRQKIEESCPGGECSPAPVPVRSCC